jgi:hypothetical protein
VRFSVIHKAFSVTLSFLVLFSTLSLTIKKHFCGDVLIDVAVFTELQKCAGDVDAITITKKPCCKDEIDVFEGVNQMTTNSFEDLDYLQKQMLFAYSFSYINSFGGLPNLVISHKDYSSHILVKDIQVLDEAYLI